MEQLAKFITDERTGLKYELCGDYYIIAGEDEAEREPIGVWGQRHGEAHRCVQLISIYGIYCNYFKNAVLPIDQELFEQIKKQNKLK